MLQGGCHFYEGYQLEVLRLPVRVLPARGVQPLVVTNAAGLITEFRFEYGKGYHYGDKLAAYSGMLGSPKPVVRAGDLEVVTWNDGRTQLELIRKAGEGFAQSLVMRDVSGK